MNKKRRKKVPCVTCNAAAYFPLLEGWITVGTPNKWECPDCTDKRNDELTGAG